MSRFTKYLLLTILILFVLACNAVTGPINQAQDLAATAQSIASAMPVETLQAIATQVATRIPAETFEALPSMVPSLEALGTGLPDFEGFFNPQGAPVPEWSEIPVMPQATAGQEFTESNTYSYKVNASVKEVQDYYNAELGNLGWSSTFNMPGGDKVAVQVYQKDNNVLTVTVTDVNGATIVVLTMG